MLAAEIEDNPSIKRFLTTSQPRGKGPQNAKSSDNLLSALDWIQVERAKALDAEKLEGQTKDLLKDTVSTLGSRIPGSSTLSSATGITFVDQTLDVLVGKIFEAIADSLFVRLSGSLPAGADDPSESALARAQSIEPPAGITKDFLKLPWPKPVKPELSRHEFSQGLEPWFGDGIGFDPKPPQDPYEEALRNHHLRRPRPPVSGKSSELWPNATERNQGQR